MPAPKIKFCGLTRVEDAEQAVAAGAWALGMIFWRGSRRRCKRERGAEIASAVRRRVELVGVFVNATLDEVGVTAEAVGLTIVQLHGDEGPAYCAEAARRTGCKVIKAARVRSRADIQALSPFHTDFHLLDGFTTGLPGGTGQAFAWELARAHTVSVPLILAGGLTPENVAAAVTTVKPFAVDVASGVEVAPGRKDPAKLHAFADAVRASGSVADAMRASGSALTPSAHLSGPGASAA
jgi:phosphoribosylanthranilate isomerase